MNKDRIREYFFRHPTERLRLRQIERNTKAAFPSVVRYAKELVEEGILKKTAISGVTFYSADRSSKRFLREKKLFNIKTVYSSGLVEYLTINYSNPTIILFGSYAEGEDIEGSDIDIYIETSKKPKKLHRFEKIFGKSIQVFNKHLKDITNKHLANNIVNGLRLNGYLEVFK